METAVKLHIYFQGELSEDEVYERLEKTLGSEVSFQVYEVRTEEN